MCDLKYLFQKRRSFLPMATWSKRNQRRSMLFGVDVRKIAGIVLVAALFVIGWLLLPGCKTVDQVLGIAPVAPTSMTLDHVYHPSTHSFSFYGSDK